MWQLLPLMYKKLKINIILLSYCLTDINLIDHCGFHLLRNLCTGFRSEASENLDLDLGIFPHRGHSLRMCSADLFKPHIPTHIWGWGLHHLRSLNASLFTLLLQVIPTPLHKPSPWRASLHVPARIFSCCGNPTLLLDFRLNQLPHDEPRNPRDSANEPAQICSQAISDIFLFRRSAMTAPMSLLAGRLWHVSGASPSMQGGTWSANEPTDVSVERALKNNLQEVKVGVSSPRRGKVSLWVQLRQITCLNTCIVCLRFVLCCQILMWNNNFTKQVCVWLQASEKLNTMRTEGMKVPYSINDKVIYLAPWEWHEIAVRSSWWCS